MPRRPFEETYGEIAVNLNMYLTESLHDRICREANKLEISRSAYIRAALTHHFTRLDKQIDQGNKEITEYLLTSGRECHKIRTE